MLSERQLVLHLDKVSNEHEKVNFLGPFMP